MSKKSKTSEINDIIDSSYTEPDYSHGNGYYDEVNDYRRKNTNTNESATINLFTKITTTRVPITLSASAPNPNPNTSNIFMKYSGDKNNEMLTGSSELFQIYIKLKIKENCETIQNITFSKTPHTI